MAKTIVTNSYNMDLLSFLNVMTSDEFYLNYYQKEYDIFYPLLSGAVKEGMNALIQSTGRSNIAPFFTTIISSLDNNNNRDPKEMLLEYDAIDKSMRKSPYYSLYSDYIKMLPQISGLIIQMIKELEDNGYREYWEKEKLPLIESRCAEIRSLLDKMDILEHISKYKTLLEGDIVIYIGAFANPHATRLYGNVLLVDYVFSDNSMMNSVIHELFHPPYKLEDVKELVDELGQKDFVIEAFKNQNPLYAYDPMELFVEENIVEALAVYAVVVLGLEDAPYKYFEKHDEGSHVISPHFFRFLTEGDIKENQPFNDYFKGFVDSLK